ncbi:hypothetical protein N0V85_002069 [Neurospora sp. IMI 360204]|nr:hypothetical protein N0V85_002069 [Neurospora sp. IMI 360204]
MRAAFRHLLLFALSAWALASTSDIDISRRNQDDTDDLDEWLAATERMSPEALKPCPISYSVAGNSSMDGWFLFPDPTKLAQCNETMILNMAVQTETGDDKAPSGQPAVKACTADYESKVKLAFVPDNEKASLCTTANRVLEEASVYMHHPQADDDDGFSTGNCLRSHVNETETLDALSMITKAGAPSNEVVVGVASYGRSFKMAQKDCTSENCLFTGSPRHSDAAEGRCTRTAGYISNAEINEIIATGNVRKLWAREGTNFLVYNDTEWVAFMDDDMKKMRAQVYDSYNFAGTTDWAVDLQRFRDGTNLGDGDSDDDNDDDDDSFEFDDIYADEDAFAKCSSDAFIEGTLDNLEEQKGRVPSNCLSQYLVQVEVSTYKTALNKYKKLMDSGYDKKFNIYKDYVIDQITSQINTYMATDKADKYFKCKKTYKERNCCPPKSCTFCYAPGCNSTPGCTNGEHTVDMDECPKFAAEPDFFSGTPIPNATFTLTDREGFFTDIAKEYGIDESWIVFDKRRLGVRNGCQYGNGTKESLDLCVSYFYNFPVRADPSKIDVFNPKDLIGGSFGQATDMLQRFGVMRSIAEWDELLEWDDLVDAMSVPAFLAEEAIASMEQVIDTAKKVEEMERKQFILDFLGGLLFWIPFVGEIVGPGLRVVGLVLRMIGRVGNAALGIYDVVNDPSNALGTILSSLIGAELGRGGFKAAAGARRSMSFKEYNNLGNVKTKLDRVENIRGAGLCSL